MKDAAPGGQPSQPVWALDIQTHIYDNIINNTARSSQFFILKGVAYL